MQKHTISLLIFHVLIKVCTHQRDLAICVFRYLMHFDDIANLHVCVHVYVCVQCM